MIEALYSGNTENEFKMTHSEDMRFAFQSPVWKTLESIVETSNKEELADILALGWLGQGYSGDNWRVIRQRAQETIERNGKEYLRYIISLACYLRKGLEALQNVPPP